MSPIPIHDGKGRNQKQAGATIDAITDRELIGTLSELFAGEIKGQSSHKVYSQEIWEIIQIETMSQV